MRVLWYAIKHLIRQLIISIFKAQMKKKHFLGFSTDTLSIVAFQKSAVVRAPL